MVVAVHVPVGGTLMYLHIAHPQCAVYLYLGVEEVGTRMTVVQSGIYHLNRAPIGGAQLVQRQYAVLPDVVEE